MKMNEMRSSSFSRPITKVLRWPTGRSMEWTSAFLASAHEDPNIVAVIASGSAVRPRVASSDLDLVVICIDPAQLHPKPPVEIDMRLYAASEVDAQVRTGHDMLGWAVKFGRVLFQRSGFWDRIVASWSSRLPLPSQVVARQRALASYRRLVELTKAGDSDAAYEQGLTLLTHVARAELIERGVYPASRPELPSQLRRVGLSALATRLENLLRRDPGGLEGIEEIANALESPTH